MKNDIRTVLLLLCTVSVVLSRELLQKANDYYHANIFTRAVKTYYRALQAGENPALVYFNLGNAYYQIDSIAKAIVCYQSSIEEAPEFFRAYLNLGILYYNLDDMASAIATLERADALEPDNVQVMLILASAYKNLHEYSVAVPLLERVLELDPKNGDCYFLLYEINRRIGDLHEAKQWLERYPGNGRRIADKYQLLGELAEETGDMSEAGYYYNQLITIAPERKWAYYQLIRILSAGGNVLTALQKADLALERYNDFGELALLAGNIAFEHKYFTKAKKYYMSAYRTGRGSGLVGLQNLIRYYSSLGDEKSVSEINACIVAGK